MAQLPDSSFTWFPWKTAPFVFTALIGLWQFVVLLHYYAKDQSDMDFCPVPLCSAADLGPLFDPLFVPDAERTVRAPDTTESVPFILHRRPCLLVNLQLSRFDWPGHAGIVKAGSRELVPMLRVGRCGAWHAGCRTDVGLSRSGVNPSVRRLPKIGLIIESVLILGIAEA